MGADAVGASVGVEVVGSEVAGSEVVGSEVEGAVVGTGGVGAAVALMYALNAPTLVLSQLVSRTQP